MATGDSANMLTRLKSLIPGGWFSRTAIVRDAVLGGLADSLSGVYGLLTTVSAQTRFSGLSGWLLDFAAWDFFGPGFMRFASESDDNFRSRFVQEVFRERATSNGIASVLDNLTGNEPEIIEFFSPGDCGGGYGVGQIAYSTAGIYGSLSYPAQVFITAYRPDTPGIANVAGYGTPAAGYGAGAGAYASITDSPGTIGDAAIYAAVSDTTAAGVTAWVEIKDAPPAATGVDFFFFS